MSACMNVTKQISWHSCKNWRHTTTDEFVSQSTDNHLRFIAIHTKRYVKRLYCICVFVYNFARTISCALLTY